MAKIYRFLLYIHLEEVKILQNESYEGFRKVLKRGVVERNLYDFLLQSIVMDRNQ